LLPEGVLAIGGGNGLGVETVDSIPSKLVPDLTSLLQSLVLVGEAKTLRPLPTHLPAVHVVIGVLVLEPNSDDGELGSQDSHADR
jgi:hypothetical protein